MAGQAICNQITISFTFREIGMKNVRNVNSITYLKQNEMVFNVAGAEDQESCETKCVWVGFNWLESKHGS